MQLQMNNRNIKLKNLCVCFTKALFTHIYYCRLKAIFSEDKIKHHTKS